MQWFAQQGLHTPMDILTWVAAITPYTVHVRISSLDNIELFIKKCFTLIDKVLRSYSMPLNKVSLYICAVQTNTYMFLCWCDITISVIVSIGALYCFAMPCWIVHLEMFQHRPLVVDKTVYSSKCKQACSHKHCYRESSLILWDYLWIFLHSSCFSYMFLTL